MKRLALIFSLIAIFFAAGGLVVSQTVKQNQDEVTIIQNPQPKADRPLDEKPQDPKSQINSKFQIPNSNADISVDPNQEEQVLGDSIDEIGMLSVNDATLEELDTIPGVGPVTAQKIIDGRPWENLDDALNLISTRWREEARGKLKL